MTATFSDAYKEYESRGITFTGRLVASKTDDGILFDVPIPTHKLKGRGDQVVYLGKGGYDSDKAHADRHFEFTQVLTIEEHMVGDYASKYIFKECPNTKFNTVMFE